MARPFPLSLIVSVAGLALGGCSSALSLLPPGIPTGSELEIYAKADFAPPYKIGATPRDTLVIGIAYVDQRCSQFFDAVEQMTRRTEVFGSGLSTGATQALTVMAVAKRSALEVARVAAAVEITKAILNEYKEQFTFAPHSAELRSLVIQSMTGQRKEFGAVLERDAQFSDVDAIAAVKKYAENCTLGAIREHWNNAVAKAVREGVQPDLPGQPATLPRAGPLVSEAISPRPANILGVNRYVVK